MKVKRFNYEEQAGYRERDLRSLDSMSQYAMAPVVMVEYMSQKHGKQFASWNWHEKLNQYCRHLNGPATSIVSTKSREEMAIFLESLIHDSDVNELRVEWGC